jgi:hypothetical protein
MSAETFLSRVRHKRTGPNTYVFHSPTRADKHPSGTLRILDDGRVLICDHGGDSTAEILAAVGLTFSDLYPERLGSDQYVTKGERRPFPAADVLRCIAFEALVVLTAGAALLAGEPFADADRARLVQAVGRVQAALAAGGLDRE